MTKSCTRLLDPVRMYDSMLRHVADELSVGRARASPGHGGGVLCSVAGTTHAVISGREMYIASTHVSLDLSSRSPARQGWSASDVMHVPVGNFHIWRCAHHGRLYIRANDPLWQRQCSDVQFPHQSVRMMDTARPLTLASCLVNKQSKARSRPFRVYMSLNRELKVNITADFSQRNFPSDTVTTINQLTRLSELPSISLAFFQLSKR